MTGFLGYGRVLVVTAVEVERGAVLAGLGSHGGGSVRVITGGVGPAAAAAATAHAVSFAALRERPFEAVIAAGIGGGFAGMVGVEGMAIATESIAADLGAESPTGFIGLDDLGFGTARHPADPALTARMSSALPHAATGPILTVCTVTGTAHRTALLGRRHPDAVAEAMEGFGVATGSAATGSAANNSAATGSAANGSAANNSAANGGGPHGTVAFGEIRAISNAVGPRDRAAWRIPQALAALRAAFSQLATVEG